MKFGGLFGGFVVLLLIVSGGCSQGKKVSSDQPRPPVVEKLNIQRPDQVSSSNQTSDGSTTSEEENIEN